MHSCHVPNHWSVSFLPLHSSCFPVYIIYLTCWRRSWKIDEVNWDCKSMIRIRSLVTFKISSLKSILLLLLLDNPMFYLLFFLIWKFMLVTVQMKYLQCFESYWMLFMSRWETLVEFSGPEVLSFKSTPARGVFVVKWLHVDIKPVLSFGCSWCYWCEKQGMERNHIIMKENLLELQK